MTMMFIIAINCSIIRKPLCHLYAARPPPTHPPGVVEDIDRWRVPVVHILSSVVCVYSGFTKPYLTIPLHTIHVYLTCIPYHTCIPNMHTVPYRGYWALVVTIIIVCDRHQWVTLTLWQWWLTVENLLSILPYQCYFSIVRYICYRCMDICYRYMDICYINFPIPMLLLSAGSKSDRS